MLNVDEFFADNVDTSKEGVEKHRKQEFTQQKTSVFTKLSIMHILNMKGEKTGKILDKYVISLYLSGISRVVKIRDAKKLYQDIENRSINGNQIADLRCILVCASLIIFLHLFQLIYIL